jgi:predicted small metal-binding protein
MHVACNDLGFDGCTYLAQGDTVDAIYANIRNHFHAVHRFDERRLISSELLPNTYRSCLYLKVASIARVSTDAAT